MLILSSRYYYFYRHFSKSWFNPSLSITPRRLVYFVISSKKTYSALCASNLSWSFFWMLLLISMSLIKSASISWLKILSSSTVFLYFSHLGNLIFSDSSKKFPLFVSLAQSIYISKVSSWGYGVENFGCTQFSTFSEF